MLSASLSHLDACNDFPVFTLSLVVEIFERSFQGARRRVPGHGHDLDGLISIFSAPKAPNAAERQILELREDVCKLLGHFGVILVRYGCRQPTRKGTATQVLHENVRVAKGLVCGRLKVENPRDRDSGMLLDYLHRSNLAEHRSSIAVIEGLMRDPSDPVHTV